METRQIVHLVVFCQRRYFHLCRSAIDEITRYAFATKDDDLERIGVLSVDHEATLSQMRQLLLKQFEDTLPSDFIFVHEDKGELDIGCETNKDTFRAQDFAKVWGGNDRLTLLLPGYVEGQVLNERESRRMEYKSMVQKFYLGYCREKVQTKPHERRKCCHQNCIADVVVESVRKYLDRGYIGGFLNHNGGALMLGIEDDRTVRTKIDDECGHLLYSDKDLDQVLRIVDSKLEHMDPPVDRDLVQVRFTPVCVRGFSANGRSPYVIEIHVAPGRRGVYFEDKYTCHAKERAESSLRVMEESKVFSRLQEDARRTGFFSLGWRGLYRQPVEFLEVIKGTKDAWKQTQDSKQKSSPKFIGRQWLFEKMSGLLESHRGVVIVGGPCTGKTAMMKELVCTTPVVNKEKGQRKPSDKDFMSWGYNFASAERDDSATPCFVVQNLLSLFLSEKKDHVKDKISKKLKEALNADDALCQCLTPDRIAVDPWRAFTYLAQALRRSWPYSVGENKEHIVLCFDGLGAEGLQDLVADAARLEPEPLLPPDVRFVVTARAPLDPRKFPTHEWATISLDSGDSEQYVLADLQAYARQLACNVTQYLEPEVLLKLCRRACGSFLYLDMAFEFCAQTAESAQESAQLLLSLPVGPTEEYLHTLFKRRFCRSGDAKEWAELRPYLELFCAGGRFTLAQLIQIRWEMSPYSAIPPCLCQNAEAVLAYVRPVLHVQHHREDSVHSENTETIRPLPIERSDAIYEFAHKEIGEWLVNLPRDLPSELSEKFSLDVPRAHTSLAAFLIRKAVNAPSERLLKQILNDSAPEAVPSLDYLLRSASEAASETSIDTCSEYPLTVEEIFRLFYHFAEAEQGGACKNPVTLLETILMSQCSPPPANLLALALGLAVRRGQERAVRLLIKILRKKSFNWESTLLCAIFDAARKNLTDVLRDLLAEAESGVINRRTADALVTAAEKGHSECCDLLLDISSYGPHLVLAQPSSTSTTSIEAVVAAVLYHRSSDEGCVNSLIALLDAFCKVLSEESNSVLCSVRDAISALDSEAVDIFGSTLGERLVIKIKNVVVAIDQEMRH